MLIHRLTALPSQLQGIVNLSRQLPFSLLKCKGLDFVSGLFHDCHAQVGQWTGAGLPATQRVQANLTCQEDTLALS